MCEEVGGFANQECIENSCAKCGNGALFETVFSTSGALPLGLVGRLSTRPNSGAEEKLDETDDEDEEWWTSRGHRVE